MSKKRKALQISTLLTAVSGVTLVMAGTSTVTQAAEANRIEERCWDQVQTNPTTQYRLNGCLYKGEGGDNPATIPDGPSTRGTGPQPGPPYSS